LAANHVVLLTPGEHPATTEALIDHYDPDVVVWAPEARDGEPTIDERRHGSRHDLHPALTLLLTTSGSTGSPKLVRLSTESLDANAAAIAASLEIGPSDRVPTTLPMHYAYGLSVIHSHLLAGAALIVTDLSVVDACFWDRFRSEGGTTLNGVPYTFDCLDRIGFADLDLPHLRSVTQAGGRLDPHRVRAYAELGQRRGWSFRVMYGQTEAAPRMAVLPADLTAAHPSSIGRAIPGGDLRIEPVPGVPDGVGELVYRGPNVMLGYAESSADLVLGRTVTELRTGDLGRRTAEGLFEVTGRRNAFVKLAGVRVDLEHLERRLHDEGLRAWPAGDDGALVVAVEGEKDAARIPALVSDLAAIPARLVRPVPVD
jgi:acyl-coenzyme A synthetase/AMP-(fatty) acid ligase